ncbi:MAG TPA: superoxide dismutase family protein [Candidatus Binatia bacterium]|jgi:Cu-Zn family superoxide dismutase|nr:superoxide dismutase family protein [Candidatus Binatia bacterium]
MTLRGFLTIIGLLSALMFSTNARAQNAASAVLKNAEGQPAGNAQFQETKEGVLVTLRVRGLPAGLHAVHIHAVGKCEGPQFTSAGGHFNPGQKKHGFKSPDGPHAGDLPDLLVVKDGTGRFEAVTDAVTFAAGQNSIFDQDGSAIVVHATADDNATDPSGNSGDRIACGVIEKSKK